MNAVKATEASNQFKNSVKTIVRKLEGRRATPKLTEAEKTTLKAEGIVKNEISASQASFDNRLANLDKLIQLLSSITEYAPNEEELKITVVTKLYNDLNATNIAVKTEKASLNNTRIALNGILYKENTGLVDVALSVKTYVKSMFGATSSQYKQVASLQFRRIEF